MKKLARDLVRRMPELTTRRQIALALENAEQNRPQIRHTILELSRLNSAQDRPDSAIVVSGGPSLHRKAPAQQIVGSEYRGAVICVDGALGYCLRNSLVPNYVVTLDPHPSRVVRWFGDPALRSTDGDDYFRRQEMDPYLGTSELARNKELVDLVNQHGPGIKAVIATSASASVTRRCLESGMDLYWWNPLLDDYDAPGSRTRQLYQSNKVPCMASGGNVGTAAWIFGHAVLGLKEIALVGMDFGYAPATHREKTQYYKEIAELFGQRAGDAFIDIHNPYTNETWFTDPAYYWYRQSFLQMARQAGCRTYNCSEGGTLIGKGIEFVPLQEFLASHRGSDGNRESARHLG